MFNLKKIGHSEANEKVIASTKLEDSGKNLIGDKLHILYNFQLEGKTFLRYILRIYERAHIDFRIILLFVKLSAYIVDY